MNSSVSSRLCVVSVASLFGLATGVAHAQTGAELLLQRVDPDKPFVASLDTRVFAGAEADAFASDVNLTTFRARGRGALSLENIIPGIERTEPRFGFDVRHLHMNVEGNFLPDNFTDASAGIGLGIASGDGWRAGLALGLGYAGAGPFGDGNGWYGLADIITVFDLDEKSSLGVYLTYNGNRTFLPDVPLLGFAYNYRPDSNWAFSLGIPFASVTWTPDTQWRLQLRYLIPDAFEATIEYSPEQLTGLTLFAELTRRRSAFHWDQLANSQDRVIFTQNRAEAGARYTLDEVLTFTLAGGYAFGQEFEVGWDARDPVLLTDLDGAFFGRAAIEVKW